MAAFKALLPGKPFFSVRFFTLLVMICAFLAPAGQSRGAELADDSTVLYYLVEMQRKYNKTCNGLAMDEAPSIVPSESLRTLALDIAQSGEAAQAVLGRVGLGSSPVFFTTASGATPQQVFENVKAQGCASMMSPSLKYIGAAPYRGAWYFLMTEREPAAEVLVPADGSAAGPAVAIPPAQPQPAVADPGVTPLLESRPHAPVVLETPVAAEPSPVPAIDGQEGGSVPEAAAAPAQPYSAPVPQARGQSLPVTPVVVAAPSISGLPAELLDGVNNYRTKGFMCGNTRMPAVPALKENSILSATAQGHAEEMAAQGYFASTSPQGVTLAERVESKGYVWANIAEVIASVSPPTGMAIDTWLSREGQCKLLMSPDYTEAGVGYEPTRKTWVLTLGTPMPIEEGAIRLDTGGVKIGK